MLHMKEIVGDYERTNGCPKVAITSGNCLIDRRLQIILGRSKRLFFLWFWQLTILLVHGLTTSEHGSPEV